MSAFLLTVLLRPAVPQQQEPISIESIVPHLAYGNLALSAKFKNLFSRRIVGTIQSGLPSVIQAEIRLLDSAKRSVVRKHITRTIIYDLWDELYTLRSPDTSLTFNKFEAVQASGSQIDSLLLTPRSQLSMQQKYRVQLRVSIIPITARQAEKVTDWLQTSSQTQEVLASDDRTSSFQLNLNKLVSFFVSSRKRSVFESDWFESRVFSLSELEEN